MLSVSDAFLQGVVGDTRDMPYRVTLAGTIVHSQTKVPKMSLSESVSGNSGVSVGTSNSATLNLTLRDAETTNYNDVLVEPECGLKLPDGTIEWVPLGKFLVTNFSTRNDYKTVELTCADGMYLMSGEYVTKLTYPAPIKDVVHEIVSMAGVEFVEPDTWPDVVVRRKPEGLTYREAIGYAAGCCGKNARFNRYGKLEFTWYTDTGITIGRRTQYLDGMTKLNDKQLKVNFEVTGKQETYSITIVAGENGGVVATPGSNVLENETVTLSVRPYSGYELATIEAVTATGKAVSLYAEADGSGYTFVQPDSDVTVTASFRESKDGPFKLTVRAFDGGTATANGDTFAKGDTVTLSIAPAEGYALDHFVTAPASLGISEDYSFEMPQSDVTINVYFKELTKTYSINRLVESGDGYILIQDADTDEYISSAAEGTTVSVTFSSADGYILDRYDSTVSLTQVGDNVYRFTMPAEEVSITAHYKSESDGKYSWLQTPQYPPSAKPYWAVLYNEDEALPTCQKYYLVWFDSWEATGYTSENDTKDWAIQFNGYYYCGSKNKGHGDHEWDTSAWSGNGATGSALNWNVYVDRMYADWDDYYGPSTQYCLLASNVDLEYNGSTIFKGCETAIIAPQTSYLQDGMDVRERGSLAQWLCPDTFSTPAPGAHWLVLMPDSGLYMTVNDEGKYQTPASSYPKSLIAFFYDDIVIQNLGAIFSDTDEEMYLASFTNGRWTYLRDSTLGWDEEIHDLPEGAVVGFRSPLNSTNPADGYLDGSNYNFAGVLATSQTLYDTSGNVFMYNNACRICDCEPVAAVRMFSVMRTATPTDAIVIENENIEVSAVGDTIVMTSDLIDVTTEDGSIVMTTKERPVPTVSEGVTISYTNPMIYEKMVPAISAQLSEVTYTPAKLKHRGNPAFQAGDIVTVPDGDGVYHKVIIMQQTMNFGGGMNSEITCPGQTAKASSFSAQGPVTVQVKNAIKQSNAELEHRLSANNSLVFASLYRTISTTESKISSIAEWQSATNSTISSISQTASDNKAKIELVVGKNGIVDEEGVVQGSIVIEAINGESTAKISADRLDIVTKALTVQDLEGNTLLSAGENKVKIGGWNVEGNSLYLGDSFATATSFFCSGESGSLQIAGRRFLNWRLKVGENFGVTADGGMYCTHGGISGFDIYGDRLEKVVSTYSEDNAIEFRDTTTLMPGLVRTMYETYLNRVSILNRTTTVSGGAVDVSIKGDEVSSTYPFMTVSINGVNYGLYIDESTMTVKVNKPTEV